MFNLLCARYYRRRASFSKPSPAGFAPIIDRSAGKGILLAAGLALLLSCGTAARRDSAPAEPKTAEATRPKPGEKVPALDDLRGYLLPERPALRRNPE